MNKIFFIGFNKTGTTSYSKIVSQHFSCLHSETWQDNSRHLPRKELLDYFKKYTCYSDGELCNFKRLDKLFPDSKFILNDRNIKNWLYSRVLWVHRKHSENLQATGWLAREYFNAHNKQDIIRLWIKRRQDYYRDVKQYFGNDSEKFMVIDIENDDVINKLSGFLKVEFSVDNIHSNKSQLDEGDFKNELSDVDRVLEKYAKNIEYFGYEFGE